MIFYFVISSTADFVSVLNKINPDQGHHHFFKIYSFFNKQKMLRAKSFFYCLGSRSVDPHIFADPDPGSKNVADLTIYIG